MTPTLTPPRLLATLVADCERQARPYRGERVASALAYRLTPHLLAAIAADDFEQARELIASYWRYLGTHEHALAALRATDDDLMQMVRGYRTRLTRHKAALSVLARGRTYGVWHARLAHPVQPRHGRCRTGYLVSAPWGA